MSQLGQYQLGYIETLSHWNQNENIANSVTACYKIACDVRSTECPTYGPGWGYASEYGSNISHSPSGTPGTCADANANRVITDGTVGVGTAIQENNKEQKRWLEGYIDSIELGSDGRVGPGDRVYWHTFDEKHTRRWNHTGIIQQTDPSRPNHS